MSSFGQWSASDRLARVTWVCGSERVLVNEVVEVTSRSTLAEDSEVWNAGQHREKDIWAAVLSGRQSADAPTRLVTVRDAGRLCQWKYLESWLRSARPLMSGCYLIFQSDESDFPRDEGSKMAEPVSWLRDSTLGQIVRCAPLDVDNAISWVRTREPRLTEDQAKHLLFRASGDLAEVSNVLRKTKLFGGFADNYTLDILCSEMPGDFTDKLISKDQPGAMLAAESLTKDTLGYSLGVLSSRLETLSMLHQAANDNMSRREVISKIGVPAFLVQKYAGSARFYDGKRTGSCWQALAVADDAYRSGITVGVAESLIVSWWL